MEFIIYVKAKCRTTITQSSGGKKCKYTIVGVLNYVWSGITVLESWLCQIKNVYLNPKAITKTIQQRVITNTGKRR